VVVRQAVAKALGGTVTINPAGFEIGRYTSALTDDAAAYFQRLEVEAAAAGASERAGEGGDASSSAGATDGWTQRLFRPWVGVK
jgi:GMP synthase-like glutamine amidotransferase